MNKKALITGITGQDGSYLAELLLNKGYEVHGIIRQGSAGLWRIEHIKNKLHLHKTPINTPENIQDIFVDILPDEIYHLAGQKQSLDLEKDFGTFPLNIDVTRSFLSLIKKNKPICRLFFAGSSEMFGYQENYPQNEITPMNPVSPYGISKVAGYFLCKMYRENYHTFTCTGILFNHESPRRSPEFVTKKITSTVVKIEKGEVEHLEVGNLNACRDWGYAGDYVEAMWLMLQQDKPDDYIIATGESHTVREFVEESFRAAGILIRWQENGLDERGVDTKTGKIVVKINQKFFRPVEMKQLVGDYRKALEVLGWKPRVPFNKLVKIMVEADIENI